MPGFDGTGPQGQGPMSGGQRGYCAVEINPNTGWPMRANGSFNRGRGRGFRNCFNATGIPGTARGRRMMRPCGGFRQAISKQTEIALLKDEAALLKNQLESINARIQETENVQKGL